MNFVVEALLYKALADVVSLLEREGIPYALIGGLAASLRGQPRITADIDLVILSDVDRVLKLASDLGATEFRPLFIDPTEVIQRSFILPLRHRTTNIKVDLAIGLSGFERQAIARAKPMHVAETIVSVATAEDLLIFKVLAGRPQDQEDIQGLVVAQGDRLDWDYCLDTASQLQQAIGHDLVESIRKLRDDQRFDD